jgi:hypothetical protein
MLTVSKPNEYGVRHIYLNNEQRGWISGEYTLISNKIIEYYPTSFGYHVAVIEETDNDTIRVLYISKVKRNGEYEYTHDHLYAKDMSKQTAKKHFRKIIEKVIDM